MFALQEQCQCAVPWLICEAFSFATQVSTLAIHAIALRTRKDKVVICVSILKLGKLTLNVCSQLFA